MFCYQCQETVKGTGCTVNGVCGKSGDVALLQDLLVHTLKEISKIAVALRSRSNEMPELDRFVAESLYMTVTNTNFDKECFVAQIRKAYDMRDLAHRKLVGEGNRSECNCGCRSSSWRTDNVEEMLTKAKVLGVLSTESEDLRSLRELLVYGVKGIAAYVKHAANLGFENREIYAFMQEALAATICVDLDAEELFSRVLGCGENGIKAMALLDEANTKTFGHPEMTKVNIGVRKNPAILVSGHDLKDLHELLVQSAGCGIDVYTHCEMLPANSYPELKKFPHFVGNYGGSWWNQETDFEKFNGAILVTTNCITPPSKKSTYSNRIFTSGVAGFEGFPHIPDRKDGKAKDFSAIIAKAVVCDSPTELEHGEIVGGFAHNQLFAYADKIVENIKSGAIKQIVVMAGCDGRSGERSYYTEYAEKLPKDSIILTAGCAKYRYNKLKLGEIHGIPRLLDAGQCNDSYSLILFAVKLKEMVGAKHINDLPILYNLAWYEQKAVLVLLSLLSLGVKNIHIGPTLPAFLSKNVLKQLVDKFGLSAEKL